MDENRIRKDIRDVLSKGNKRWKHLEIIYDYVLSTKKDDLEDPDNDPLFEKEIREIRDIIAALMVEGYVLSNMDPRDGRPVFALKERIEGHAA